ncbi:dihydrodipicolinate synthase family protein [Nocardia sp. NPDC052112]|uniref:dihydrodipicolinate synthase family protein n=1 Tax=Nocardia sp. NPDC052112 TaxID=3155646 RepID=UPI00343296E8
MNRNDVAWSGYWPAAPTPFTVTGALDGAALASLVELYARHRVNGVLINGSTGEWFSQTLDERREVARIAVETVAGRFPVVIGVTAYTPDESIALARHAEQIGADGALATPPPYVHPSPDEIVAFYRAVSSATSLPFMVYNWPRGVAVDMGATPGLFHRLAELDRVVAIKDSTGNWLGMLDTVEQLSPEVRVFGSFLHRRGLAVLQNIGGDGNIDGGGIGAPFAVPYYQAAFAGDRGAASMWADKYQLLSGKLIRPDYSGVFASPIPQLKAVMSILGQPGGHVRAPLLPFSGDFAALERVVAESGIAEAAQGAGALDV